MTLDKIHPHDRKLQLSQYTKSYNSAYPSYGRYVRLVRENPTPIGLGSGNNIINILGIDVYDLNGAFISDQSTPYISSIHLNDPNKHGPNYLIDGVHEEFKTDGTSYRLPHTTNNPGVYMQLDFGRDVWISRIVIWNRNMGGMMAKERILGCTLWVYDSNMNGQLRDEIPTAVDVLKYEIFKIPGFTFSSRYGGTGGVASVPLRCPIGRYAKSIGLAINANAQSYAFNFVTGVSVKCDDGTTLNHRAGHDSNNQFTYAADCSGGFNSLPQIKFGGAFGTLKTYCPSSSVISNKLGNSFTSIQNFYKKSFSCYYENQRIVGLTILSGDYIYSLRVICSDDNSPLTSATIDALVFTYANTTYPWAGANVLAKLMYGNIHTWNISLIKSMKDVFSDFNRYALGGYSSIKIKNTVWNDVPFNISTWDVSSVTDMTRMFYGAAIFNDDVSLWSMSNVRSMRSMFQNAVNFNQDLSLWNVTNCEDFGYMFGNATKFNRDLSKWSMSSATSITSMFQDAVSFNGNISAWDTSAVYDMSKVFYGALSLKQTDICWDVSKAGDTFADIFVGSSGAAFSSFPYPACKNLHMETISGKILLYPSPSTYGGGYYWTDAISLTMVNQKRVILSLLTSPDLREFRMDNQIQVTLDVVLTQREGRRHSICFMERETDLLTYCFSNSTSCVYCFDIAGSALSQLSLSPRASLNKTTSYSFKPMDYADKQALFGKTIKFIAFVNDGDGNVSLPPPKIVFSNINWIQLRSLSIVSTSFTDINVKFANSSVAANISKFVLSMKKVLSPYSIQDTDKANSVYARSDLVAGLTYGQLEAGIRYSFLYQPAYDNGTIIQADLRNQFFGYGIVMCTCTPSSGEQTGSPAAVSVKQQYGFISITFTDYSVCEDAYALTRRQIIQNTTYPPVSFAPSYFFYSTSECGLQLRPGRNFADDLSLSRLDVSATYMYCSEAIAPNYMASEYIYNPNRVSSDPACQTVIIAWEASISGLITSKADTGSIPIQSVVISWQLMDPYNETVVMNCTSIQSICSGSYTTDTSGSFKAEFWADEPQYRLTRTDPIPVLVTFYRSFDNQSDTFLSNNEQTMIPPSGMIIFLKHLEFDRSLFIVDASTVAFTGSVFVRNTSFGSKYGCPVVQAKVCAFESKTMTGGSTQNFQLACHETNSDGLFNLPLPIGAIVHNVTVSYYDHEFSVASNNPFADQYKNGLVIDPRNTYYDNNFVDLTVAPVALDIVGGLCNKTLGETTYIRYTILGCNWKGNILQKKKKEMNSLQYVPAFVINFSDVIVLDSRNVSISVINNYFSEKHLVVDLRKWVDPSAALLRSDNDIAGADSGVTSATSNNFVNISYVRFQYDGDLKLSFDILSEDMIGKECMQNDNDTHSMHVVKYFTTLNFDVHVFFQILPGLTCDLVESGTTVTLENHLGYENIPNFEQSDFYTSLSNDEKEMLSVCYPSCVNDVVYNSNSSDAGLHNFTLYLGRPEITPPYTRSLKIKVSGYNSNSEYMEFVHVASFVIQGLYKNGNGQSFALPTHTPVLILRDPPGGTSSAHYENIHTSVSITSEERTETLSNEFSVGAKLLSGVKLGKCFGLGVSVCTDTDIETQVTLFDFSIDVGGRTKYWKEEVSKSRSITWTYETSSDPWLAGAMSDIFVGRCIHLFDFL